MVMKGQAPGLLRKAESIVNRRFGMGYHLGRTLPRRIGGMGLAILLCACSAERVHGPDVLVQDSAGIRIVENRLADPLVPPFGELGGIQLEVGVRDGDPRYALTEVLAARTTGSGELLIAESRARELRYFDASGRHLRTVGGAGEGPGEFSGLSTLAGMAGDTVWIWDARAQRMTSFGPGGELLEAAGIPPRDTYDRLSRVYRLADGTWVGVSPWRNRERGAPRSEPLHVGRDSLVLRHLGSDGEELDTMVVVPGGETLRQVELNGTRIAEINFRRPFGRSTFVATGPRSVVVGWSDRFEIRRFSPAGVL